MSAARRQATGHPPRSGRREAGPVARVVGGRVRLFVGLAVWPSWPCSSSSRAGSASAGRCSPPWPPAPGLPAAGARRACGRHRPARPGADRQPASRELGDAGLVAVGGLLMVLPGFLGDLLGLLCLLPVDARAGARADRADRRRGRLPVAMRPPVRLGVPRRAGRRVSRRAAPGDPAGHRGGGRARRPGGAPPRLSAGRGYAPVEPRAVPFRLRSAGARTPAAEHLGRSERTSSRSSTERRSSSMSQWVRGA